MDNPDLQDNPKVWWDTELIEKIVHEHVERWKIDAVRYPLLSFLIPPLRFEIPKAQS